jgi:DNA polymerase III delta subunit
MSASEATGAGFVLLCGDETILRERARADIIASVRKIHPDAGIERHNAEDGDVSSFCERVITPSLLASMRVFILTDVHQLNEKDLDMLGGLFAYDLPDACVIMETDRARAGTGKKSKTTTVSKKYLAWLDSFDEMAQQHPQRFSIQEFVKPPDYKMAEWVEAQVPHLFGRRISKANAEYLVDLVGADTAILYSELQKIDLYLPDKAVVDKNVIDTVAGSTRLMTQFELAAALGKKDLVRAMEIIESIYTGNVYLPLFVGAIFRHFWSLYKISEFAKVNPDVVRRFSASLKGYNRQQQEETGVAIGVAAGLLTEKQGRSVYPVIVKSGIVDQAMSYETEHYKAIFSLLKEYDVGLKTGKADDSKTGFQLFCYRIARGGLS